MAANLRFVQRLQEIAAVKGCTPGQLALAWVSAQWEGVVAIPGTKRRTYLEENVASIEVVLSAEELAQIAGAIPPAEVVGERYSEQSMRTVNG